MNDLSLANHENKIDPFLFDGEDKVDVVMIWSPHRHPLQPREREISGVFSSLLHSIGSFISPSSCYFRKGTLAHVKRIVATANGEIGLSSRLIFDSILLTGLDSHCSKDEANSKAGFVLFL